MKTVKPRDRKKPANAKASEAQDKMMECCASILTLAEMLEIYGAHVQAGRVNGKMVIQFGRMLFRESERLRDLLSNVSKAP